MNAGVVYSQVVEAVFLVPLGLRMTVDKTRPRV